MARLEVRGGTMDIVSVGEGPDLVLLHSLLIDRSAFARIVPESTKDRRVHLVVLPGFDASSPAGPGVEDHADRIAEALRALGLGPGGAVLGNGFGGFVVAALAAPHGALFEKLLLVDTAARFPQQARSAFAVMAEKVAAGGMEASPKSRRGASFTMRISRPTPEQSQSAGRYSSASIPTPSLPRPALWSGSISEARSRGSRTRRLSWWASSTLHPA